MEKLATIIPRPALTLPDVLGDDKQGRAHRPGVTPAAIRGDGAGTRSPPYGAGRVAAASPVTSRPTRQARIYSAPKRNPVP